MKVCQRKQMIVLMAMVLLSGSAAAHVRTDSVDRELQLGNVVVTGTRTPRPLLKSPVQTLVISSDVIRKSDATNLRDLLQLELPGIEFSYAMNQQVHMNFSGFGGQNMLILVDGERLSGETMDDVDFTRLTMDNVERIEIVKGAASALYGSNANGGVINIITKEGDKPFALQVNGRLARHHEQRYGLSLQNGGSRLQNLFAVSRSGTDNYDVRSGDHPVTRVLSTIYGDAVWNVSDKVSYRPLDHLKLMGRAGYFRRQLVRTADIPERYRDFTAGLRALWDITPADQLSASYAFDQYDKSNFQRIVGLDIRDYSNVQNSFRLLYSHQFAGDNVFLAGADYMHDYLFNTKLEGQTREQNSFDAFAQFDWNISPQWEMVAALRYDYFSDNRISRLTPKLSARWQAAQGLNVRFGYGMGFRAPSLKERYYDFDMAGIWLVEGNPGLRPEVSHNFNASAEYVHRQYNLMLSTYCNRIFNKIATGAPYFANATDQMPRLPYLNLDNYTVAGAEASVRARWACGLSARISYVFTKEHLPKDKKGDRVNNQYIPAREHSMTFHVDWDRQLTRRYGLDVALDGRFLSGVDNQEFVDYYDISKGTNTIHYPSYHIWKLSVVQRFGKAFRLTAAVDNLFNYKPTYYYLNSPITDGANFMVGMSVDIDQLF